MAHKHLNWSCLFKLLAVVALDGVAIAAAVVIVIMDVCCMNYAKAPLSTDSSFFNSRRHRNVNRNDGKITCARGDCAIFFSVSIHIESNKWRFALQTRHIFMQLTSSCCRAQFLHTNTHTHCRRIESKATFLSLSSFGEQCLKHSKSHFIVHCVFCVCRFALHSLH